MPAATPGTANIYATVAPTSNASNITINEIETNNTTGITDKYGNHSNWVELYNKGTTAVAMQGLRLTDGTSVWAFQATTLNPGQYLIVFLSGQNDSGSQLATNFIIPSTGGTLKLINKDNPTFTVVESVTIPSLSQDASYGRDPNNTSTFIIMPTSTPGGLNNVPANADAQYLKVNEVVTSNKTILADYQGQ